MVSHELIARHCVCCGCDQLQRSPAVLMPFVALRVFGHEPVEITADWGLRDLRQGTAYTLCNSLQCQECGGLFLDYRFTDEQMGALYHNYRDDLYNTQRTRFEPGYANVIAHYHQRAAYLDEVEEWLAPRLPEAPAILDWGGDSGINSPFREHNRLLHIHDISGVELVAGAERVDLQRIGQTHYDLVSCSQVLEHVSFPRQLVEQMLSAVGKGTLLYLEVPHEVLVREHPGSLELAPLKRHWHEHVNFFTEAAMRRLLEGLGLEVVDILRLPVELEWTSSEVLGVLARRV
ncbi:class I SAM-dependent methyltransferase [Pseudomonas putida]|uniref:class I SAM-dependent methyltransferase n=1 Tax=Pseudomonas putida TaxID=303 RepID=UPI002363CD18|nr:class I SAM-dependent methyltransferase [Pseudomonas putida]MDD1988722.1 class I SAM-dependent methyltransferase [Pseudomonas putida]HDS1796437.1 class I SAM-dependent methyltransferase [Pseudomonas putida]